MSSSTGPEGGSAARPRRLVLHFDINKTIIMKDPAKNIETEGMLNSLLSECVWGRAPPGVGSLTAADWTALSPVISTEKPSEEAVTYGDYVENVLKLPRAERTALKTRFTTPGAPGEGCRAALEALRVAMRAPPLREDCPGGPLLQPLFADGFVHILPSFFKLVTTLTERGGDFRVVFRTFGVDIDRVCCEYNLFCEGGHPLSPPGLRMDGSGGSVDRRVRLPDCGCTLQRGPGPHDVNIVLAAGIEDPTGGSLSGVGGLNRLLREWFAAGHNAAAVQDHFEYWSRHGESETSGKLLVLEEEDTGNRPHGSERHIFFDDNIELDRAHIVDVRRANGTPVPFHEANGRWIAKAEPWLAITRETYFIELLDRMLHRETA